MPERFFERTYLTQNLCGLAAEVVRRLSGEKTETSAVFNMSTQFGGDDGTPLRKTPWGEIAFQLGGKEALAVLAAHEKEMTAPAGDVIRKFLPKDRPCLILMDELMNYVSRKSGIAAQLYNFIENLCEVVTTSDRLVLVTSVPASELEMTAEDVADFSRFQNKIEKFGKAVIISAEAETSEIIRRRLFEWFGLSDDAKKTIAEYADWIVDHRQQVPNWFPIDNARDAFAATYPFHPTVLSVFERKWQGLPCFQQTRGVLRVLALWVSKAYSEGYRGGHKDQLIGLGTAPLDDPMFRAALFEQLGESRLEGAVTTDICGKKDAFAVRLDNEAVDAIKKAQRDIKESVWRTYKNLMLLGKDNRMRPIDLGLVHSSAADTMVTLIMNRLRQDGDVEEGISPNFLVRNWPPAFKEWATKSARDAFFASPQFPRLLNGEVIRDTIARGVSSGVLAYVGKTESGDYDPFVYASTLSASDVELSADVYIVTKETADAYLVAKAARPTAPVPADGSKKPTPVWLATYQPRSG